MRGLLSRDQIADQVSLFNDASKLRVPAFAVIDRLQMTAEHYTPGEQIIGTAVALIAMCQSANVNLQDVLTKASRALSDTEGPYSTHMRAIRDYAANELRGRP
jgi:hypothetical protein